MKTQRAGDRCALGGNGTLGLPYATPAAASPGPVRAHMVKLCMQAQTRPSRPYPQHIPAIAHVRDLARPGRMAWAGFLFV
jgi:hypothetical protein